MDRIACKYCSKCDALIPSDDLYRFYKFARGHMYQGRRNVFIKELRYADVYNFLVCKTCGHSNRVIIPDEDLIEREVDAEKARISKQFVKGFKIACTVTFVLFFWLRNEPGLLVGSVSFIWIGYFAMSGLYWTSQFPDTEINCVINHCSVLPYSPMEEPINAADVLPVTIPSPNDADLDTTAEASETKDTEHLQNVDNAESLGYFCPECRTPFAETFKKGYIHTQQNPE